MHTLYLLPELPSHVSSPDVSFRTTTDDGSGFPLVRSPLAPSIPAQKRHARSSSTASGACEGRGAGMGSERPGVT
eukprot:707707-Rhodomonas_salina.2